MSKLFKLREPIEGKLRYLLEFLGIVVILIIWSLLSFAMSDVRAVTELKGDDLSPNVEVLDSLEKARAAADTTGVDSTKGAGLFDFDVENATTTVYASDEEEVVDSNAVMQRVYSNLLPPPWKVFSAFGDLHRDNQLWKNLGFSLQINLLGYLEAILIALPLGFIIGLIPLFRGLFNRQVDAIRFMPLTALTGLFILAFGTDMDMKVHFLAFGIMVYLLPVVVQRIDEVQDVYLKTVFTLGATPWQTVKTVYIPSVISRISDDIRVLTAISWTYIIIAEMLNSTSGVGALIFKAGQRQGRIDKVFAILILILIIGFIQDKFLLWLDRVLFPYKYNTSGRA